MNDETRAYLDKAMADRCRTWYTVEEYCLKPKDHADDHGPREPITFEQVSDDRAVHAFPIYAQEERCRCGFPAAHKVEETTGPRNFHPLTAYLCCACFQTIGNCGSYPYEPAGPYTPEETN